jgi:hypothetical protein
VVRGRGRHRRRDCRRECGVGLCRVRAPTTFTATSLVVVALSLGSYLWGKSEATIPESEATIPESEAVGTDQGEIDP